MGQKNSTEEGRLMLRLRIILQLMKEINFIQYGVKRKDKVKIKTQ